MRAVLLALAALAAAACSGGSRDRQSEAAAARGPDPAGGEERVRIAAGGGAVATLRSGPKTPVMLPPGFTLYPGAEVVSSTVVARGGERRILVVFDTPEPIAKILLYYRAEAQAAGVLLAFDLGGKERASLGGILPCGGELAIAARRGPAGTRVEFSAN